MGNDVFNVDDINNQLDYIPPSSPEHPDNYSSPPPEPDPTAPPEVPTPVDEQTDTAINAVNPDAYGSGLTFDFTGRFSTFVNDMKQSSLFSIPGALLDSIPCSSNSMISFDGGMYGQHDFDFSDWSTVFLTLKSILLVAFSYVAVRILFKS